MSFLDYDNISKWLGWFSKRSFWFKAVFVGFIIVVLSAWLFVKYGTIRELNEDIADLKQELAQAKSEVSTLRDRKNELHRENLHLQEINTFIQEKAKQLYPEMDPNEAIKRLTEDIKTVRSLATQDVYKPLAAQKKKELISKLKELLAQHTSFTHTVTISYQQVISAHAKVVDDLEQYLGEAGFEVEFGSIMKGYRRNPPNISIKFHPEDEEFVRQFVAALNPLYIDEKFQGITQERLIVVVSKLR
jgi:cell division protein FtsB